jgi:hypothetical protein
MNKVDDAIPAITTAKIEQSGSGIFLRVVGINLENGPAGLTVVWYVFSLSGWRGLVGARGRW